MARQVWQGDHRKWFAAILKKYGIRSKKENSGPD